MRAAALRCDRFSNLSAESTEPTSESDDNVAKRLWLSTLLVLFASESALLAMQQHQLLHLSAEDCQWEQRFRHVADTTDGFYHTITVRAGEWTDKEAKKSGVCHFRTHLLGLAANDTFSCKNLVRQIHLQTHLQHEDATSGMHFGLFKAYVAAKVVGYVNPGIFNMCPPPNEYTRFFSDMDHKDAQGLLLEYVEQNYDIHVGPHTELHLRRAFGLPAKDQPPFRRVSADLLRALMVRHYVEVFPALTSVMGLTGFSVHDDQHSGCEEEKIHMLRLGLSASLGS